jgi:dTDP-4-amino-4,6-dideoxygalactose transaminase
MKVPLLDLEAQYRTLGPELEAAVCRVMRSQRFILGPEVRQLEEEIARYAQTRHAIGCSSGSDALLLALMALGIGPGDEVITTPFTFFATAGAIARLGARPVFVDIDPRDYNIDPNRIEAAITSRTRAILPVHLYGQCASMDEIIAIGRRHDLPIIEDAAQAIGAEDRGRRAGSMGAIGCFSFYPTKNLGGAGDGGMLVTSDDRLAERLRMLRVHGSASEYHHQMVGINGRLDEIQAAVLRAKMAHLDQWSDARREKANTYARLFAEAGLAGLITLPFVRRDCRHIFHQYVARVPERDALIEHLKRHSVGTRIYYPVPLHMQECFRYLGHTAGDFPEAERAARETIALPMYPELSTEQQQYVVDAIRRFYR